MAWYNFWKDQQQLDESIKAFKNRDKTSGLTQSEYNNKSGEGIEDLAMMQMGGGFGAQGIGGFNSFYNSHINKLFENEYQRIVEYRRMAEYPEIADVIEDACNEMCDIDEDQNILSLDITDSKISENDNITKILYREFKTLFYDRIDVNDNLWDYFRTYLIDGRIYYERIIDINNKNKGLLNIKKLPTETMDFEYEPKTGRIISYYQYLSPNYRRPINREQAIKDAELGKMIIFEPAQIGFINYGIYGLTKANILGFLEKAKVPYNQLKLLETSVIIYRLIRSPERLVFKIDTGAMPRDKAMKFVEKIKQSFIKKQSYNPQTGSLSNEPEVFCIKHDTEIPLLDGRFLTLDQLVDEHKEGKENWVYSIDQKTLDIKPGKIKNAAITRLNTEMVRVWLDNGHYIDCTPDHKFILRDGSECEAGKLMNDVSLMPLYTRMGHIGTNKVEYQQVYNPSNEKWVYTHRMVNGKAKKGNVIHHKDFNRFNNKPDNLIEMSSDSHSHMHGELIKNMFKNPEYRKKHSEWVIRTNKEQGKAKKMQAVLNTPEVREYQKLRAKESRDEYWSIQENRDNIRDRKTFLIDDNVLYMFGEMYLDNVGCKRNDFLNILSSNHVFMSYLEELNKDQDINNKQFDHITRPVLNKIIKNMGHEDYPDFRENYTGYMNHKVVRVEILDEKSDCGCLEIEGDNHNFAVSMHGNPCVFIKNSILENYFMPQSSEGRGSDITSVGGNSAGFTQLDDIYYFSHKLYRSLKYPLSRITQGVEQGQEVMFGGTGAGEISRDEIKWAKFLERQQRKFCNDFVDLFLLHLDFKGFKKQYNLNSNSFTIRMNPPSQYKEQMIQGFLEQSFQNYNALCQNAEFSKSFLIKKFLHWTEEELEENREGFKLDKRYFPPDEVLDNVDSYGANGMAPGTLSLQMQAQQDMQQQNGQETNSGFEDEEMM
jgi:hypothetical protein